MKSFSKIYPQPAREQLEAWDLSEFDADLAMPANTVQTEQILEVFHNGKQADAGPRKRSQPIFRPLMTEVAVTAWQPEEFDLQVPLVKSPEWEVLEPGIEFEEQSKEEAWLEESNPEKEAITILTQARAQAEEIILEARAAADKIILQAQDEINQEKKAGYQQGRKEARNELGQALKAVHAVVEDVRQWRDSLVTQGEQILVELLKEIAQTMFGEGVRLDANALQINLNRVMEHAQKLGDLNIFLNTRDAEVFDPSWSEYQLLITGNKVKIIPSEKITPGGCIIKGSMGMVDARVETQLAAVLNTIEEVRGASE
jgi:flagellar biosynthesis/type III secretory pathway protein FliH